jgi:hypothetical protein
MALLMAMYIKVKMCNMSDLVLVQHHFIKDSWTYLNTWEIKCLD